MRCTDAEESVVHYSQEGLQAMTWGPKQHWNHT